MKITEDIIYVGVNDHEVDLFEGQYVVPNGMAYNSYLIMDKKIAVYCRSGRRSAGAAGKLSYEGYKLVNLKGGIIAWKAANMPVTASYRPASDN